MSLPTRGSVSPYRRHTLSSFPPSPTPRQLRLKTSSSTPSQERNSNGDAGPRAATHLQTPPWQSVLYGTPPAADPVGPGPPPETTRRTVKDDWPNSHPADLRSRHAILLGARETRKTQFYKKESSGPGNKSSDSSHLLYHSNTPTPTHFLFSIAVLLVSRIRTNLQDSLGSRLPRSPLTLKCLSV